MISLLAALLLTLAGAAGADGGSSIASHVPEETTDPERVVALEFLETEIALALDLPVVGVADKGPYRRWVGAKGRTLEDAASVGGRSEPGLEALIRLQPDLILGSSWRHGGVADRLAQVAPLLLYRDLPRPSVTDQYTRMRAIVRDLGARTGRGREAAALLDELDARLAAGRARLAQAGHDGAPVVLGQLVPGNDRIRLFTDNSLAVQIFERLGLVNGREAPAGDYGYRAAELGDLARLPEDAHLLLSADPDSDRFRELIGHPVWPQLAPVQSGRFHRIARDLWFFGGPLSAMRLADELVDALVATPGEDEH